VTAQLAASQEGLSFVKEVISKLFCEILFLFHEVSVCVCIIYLMALSKMQIIFR
jgi:hypothetical protein